MIIAESAAYALIMTSSQPKYRFGRRCWRTSSPREINKAIATANQIFGKKEQKNPRKENSRRCNFSSGLDMKDCEISISVMQIHVLMIKVFECQIWDFKSFPKTTKPTKKETAMTR